MCPHFAQILHDNQLHSLTWCLMSTSATYVMTLLKLFGEARLWAFKTIVLSSNCFVADFDTQMHLVQHHTSVLEAENFTKLGGNVQKVGLLLNKWQLWGQLNSCFKQGKGPHRKPSENNSSSSSTDAAKWKTWRRLCVEFVSHETCKAHPEKLAPLQSN